MAKIVLLGAGSGFTQPLFTDILNIEGMDRGVIGLVDIDRKRLGVNIRLMERILNQMGKKRWKIEASTRRTDVLKGADYLISTIEVAGLECVAHDNRIPGKYGIDQCIGDTIGPGGIMKAVRTIPPFIAILEDAKRLCPDALLMNYTNPMSMMTLAAARVTDQPFVGLCHSVQGTSRQLAQILDIPYERMVWKCGGINHMAWFTELKYRGRDLYPYLLDAMADKETYERDPVRFELMKEFGFFVTESSGHMSEYVPYFRKRPDLVKRYCRDKYRGGSGFYGKNWPTWRKRTDRRRRAMANGKMPIHLGRGYEYAADIVEAHVFDRRKFIHGSVPNTGLIPNLPQTGVVEVGVVVDKEGFTPTYFGNLPEQIAALCRANMAVFELCVDGILKKNRESIIHAMLLDPLTAAVCSPAQIRSMTEELFAAEKKYLPAWIARKPKPRRLRPLVNKPRKRAGRDAAAQVSSMAARNVS